MAFEHEFRPLMEEQKQTLWTRTQRLIADMPSTELSFRIVRATNSTKVKNLVVARMKNFEPKEKTDMIDQMDGFYAYRPTLLRSWNTTSTERWLREGWFRGDYQFLQLIC